MTKYLKVDDDVIPSTQSEISDELAELWISNSNENISDKPWPDLPIVKSYIVSN
jgi:hypothetical protein